MSKEDSSPMKVNVRALWAFLSTLRDKNKTGDKYQHLGADLSHNFPPIMLLNSWAPRRPLHFPDPPPAPEAPVRFLPRGSPEVGRVTVRVAGWEAPSPPPAPDHSQDDTAIKALRGWSDSNPVSPQWQVQQFTAAFTPCCAPTARSVVQITMRANGR